MREKINMTIRRLKEVIADMPDDLRVCLDDGDLSEIVCAISFVPPTQYDGKCILQTKNDFDVVEELNARLEWASENDIDEETFYWDFVEDGYVPEDFNDKEQENHTRKYLVEHWLLYEGGN